MNTGHPKFVISPYELMALHLYFFLYTGQIAEIYILSQPFILKIMATEPPVINLQPGNFTLDIPASIIMLTQPENSTMQHIVSMDFVSLERQEGTLRCHSC
jgi:hypothetical protein